MITTGLHRNTHYLIDEFAEDTACNYADCRQMSTCVFFGCDLEMYRILREQMWCALGNFNFTVDWSIFSLLGMMAYCCLITVCLVMFAGNFA